MRKSRAPRKNASPPFYKNTKSESFTCRWWLGISFGELDGLAYLSSTHADQSSACWRHHHVTLSSRVTWSPAGRHEFVLGYFNHQYDETNTIVFSLSGLLVTPPEAFPGMPHETGILWYSSKIDYTSLPPTGLIVIYWEARTESRSLFPDE